MDRTFFKTYQFKILVICNHRDFEIETTESCLIIEILDFVSILNKFAF